MTDILDAVNSRIKAPFFGFVLLAFIAINWRALFLLIMLDAPASVRLAVFDERTGIFSLAIFPVISGALATFVSPWLKLVFMWLSTSPLDRLNIIHHRLKRSNLEREKETEAALAELYANKESELIDRAQRDEAIQNIEDEELKKQLQAEVQALRDERDQLSKKQESSDGLSLAEYELIKAAGEDGDGNILILEYLEGTTIQAGQLTLSKISQREISRYKSAIDSLLSKKLIRRINSDKPFYELTEKGWNVSESLP